GFAAWDRQYRPGIRSSITPRFHLIINGLLLVLCFDVGELGPRPIGVALWLTVMALMCTNAGWHVLGAAKTRTYSPGMVTGVLLYVPLAVYGYVVFLASGEASPMTAIVAFAVGASYHLWARGLHRLRARRRKSAVEPRAGLS